MLLHVYSSGATQHIVKLYNQVGIKAKFITSSFLKDQDMLGVTHVIVDSIISLEAAGRVLKETKLYQGGKPTFKAMMGSMIRTESKISKQPVDLMAGLSPKQLYTRQGQVIFFKLLKKITSPKSYARISPPNITRIVSDTNILAYAEKRASDLGGEIVMIGLDTETKQEGLVTGKSGKCHWIYNMIELVQATFATKKKDGQYDLFTTVFEFKRKCDYDNIVRICSSDYPKVFSNAHYDIEQFLHWQIPIVNLGWDVEYYSRSITPDLTGYYSLGLNAAIWNRHIQTWKDLTNHKTDRNETQYQAFIKYSGLDTHWTTATAIQQMLSAGGQNLKNYLMKQEFDGLTSFMNLQLLPIDEDVQMKMLADATTSRVDNGKWFKQATGLNHTQNKKLLPLFRTLHFNMRKFGYPDMGQLSSLSEKELSGLKNSHPFWEAAINKFLDAKHGEKDGSTFLQYIKYYQSHDLNKERPYFDYSMSQYITATLRYASKQSNAWCGGNVQNISAYHRKQYKVSAPQVIISIDAPQSEARTVGYLSQCLTIINVLEDPNLDYHIFNAANAVFKKPYETITILERKLSKPPGFGFFYGQKWHGLMLTLGVKAMRQLRETMGLGTHVSLPAVAKMASDGIDSLYWEIRKRYYPIVVDKYRRTSRVPTITGYSPILISDINQGTTVRTVVCIDGQHTSAHINMIGGVRMLYKFLYGDKPIERSMYPYLQLHDEIQARCDDHFTVKEVDDYTEELFRNMYIVHGRQLIIPRGVPVFGQTLFDLKGDEIERTEEVNNMTLREVNDAKQFKH